MKDRETLVRQNVRSVAVEAERHRIVGLLLAEVGRLRLAGATDAAAALDRVTLAIEHPEAA